MGPHSGNAGKRQVRHHSHRLIEIDLTHVAMGVMQGSQVRLEERQKPGLPEIPRAFSTMKRISSNCIDSEIARYRQVDVSMMYQIAVYGPADKAPFSAHLPAV